MDTTTRPELRLSSTCRAFAGSGTSVADVARYASRTDLVALDNPLVSVCIPTFNGAQFLEEALASVVAQTYAPLEIVCSDDGSTDETQSILRLFAKCFDAPVVIQRHQRGLTPAANWNACARRAKGEFVKFLFQDDTLYPDCIERLVRAAAIRERPGLTFCRRVVRVEVGMIAPPDPLHIIKSAVDDVHKSWSSLLAVQEGTHLLADSRLMTRPRNKIGEPTAVLLRRDLSDQIGWFDEGLNQLADLDLWFRLMRIGYVSFVDEYLCTFRVHHRQATFTNVTSPKHAREIRRLCTKLIRSGIVDLMNVDCRREVVSLAG